MSAEHNFNDVAAGNGCSGLADETLRPAAPGVNLERLKHERDGWRFVEHVPPAAG